MATRTSSIRRPSSAPCRAPLYRCLAVCLTLGWMFFQPQRSLADAVFTTEGAYFEVVGSDDRSVAAVGRLCEHIVATCGKYLNRLPTSYPQRILVVLRPASDVAFSGDYTTRSQVGGFVQVDFRWDAALDLEMVCRGLTEAFIQRYAIYHHGLKAPQRMHSWPVSALSTQAYLSLRTAQLDTFIDELRMVEPPDIQVLLGQSYVDGMPWGTGREGYWLLRSLRAHSIQSRQIARLIERAIAGNSDVQALQSLLQAQGWGRVAIEDWWSERMLALTQVKLGRVESMAVSQAWIGKAADFTLYQGEGRQLADLRALWQLREDATVREMLMARRELIALRIGRVNPAYFNAARSLGALYETVLDGVQTHEFVHALTVFLGDFEDAKHLQRMTNAHLDRLPAN